MNKTLRQWIVDCPVVINRTVIIDVRGPHPVAVIGMISAKIETRDDFINFVIQNVRD